MQKTTAAYQEVIRTCKEVYVSKMKDYGSAWRILRTSSLTDQIYIKANRIRSIDEKGIQKINEGIYTEFVGLINYSIIALIQLELGEDEKRHLGMDEAITFYEKYFLKAMDLMMDKNHDYGEAWRNMRISSFTDIILMKILRIKQIEDNQGKTFVSEGVDANYYDIINYSVFALIKLNEQQE